MPEGHTIHRLARDHQRDFAGQHLSVSSPQGRFRSGARKLDGTLLKGVEACGKHLFYQWESHILHVHLGLYGKFRRHRLPVPEPRGQVRLRMTGAERAVDLNGPTRCELITRKEQQAVFDRLGPDPLHPKADAERVWNRIHRSRAAIGTLLLNQSVIAGIGNVYRAEILFLLGINPDTPGRLLDRDEFDQLWDLSCELLKIGVRYNRIIVADPQDVGKPRSRMNRTERLLIYKKQTCSRCETPVESWLVGNRRIYACVVCQPQRDE